MQQYRIKFFLEDGRLIYASKRGKLETIPEDRKEKLYSQAEKAAYSKDLITFSSVDYFETMQAPYVRVSSVVLEPVEGPLDENAILFSEEPE
ncbi:hypothetical protein HNR65_002135 [Desulfosalsimonas propionicica]|uniref:Uncharacterized protein n=1 Tax=Desulfosalsimonas propionicica TaxID=332175 RepID=A0A7W0C9S8_9BACT|nr:hypothetical protein [Desulfosalsimonas propionicica]MBA2881804.1 hypothetical protein [Desulfosalsimonas propionicica]